ncbi:MAG: hypothetical protein UT12_C0001G0011 [Candidatus Curtissbacteria bacterium GW2011_GWC2_38_9]|uniref:Glycosyltransferase RgtA/B/C/D-like domain-containing protein n=2 Tax=Candidatus Curtissiibacteriota TaxID=1752717 RepID=A0A0G0LE52_9BACT|nr:MAG: hypothetical protein UT12_C0001G0011 [Candidatus Curtissbacteria bacterium GW2011_GWC2_38_9]
MSNAKIPNMMIWLILLVTFVLRMINLNQSLWLDEAINVNVAKALSYKSLIFNYSLGDFHPPLYHIILKSWILFFGSSEISVRIPSVILGVATVFVTYLIGKKLFENKTALIAATLMATSPLSIYYSQEARMYMLAAFFASLSVFFFISILKKDDFWLWFGFIISTALMLYSDYLPYLLIPIYFLYLLINKRKVAKNTLKSFIPAFILISILITPWLIILPKQISVGLSAATASPAWAQVVGAPSIQNLLITFVKFTIGRISYDNNLVYALLFAPAAFFIIFLFLLSLFRMSPLRFFLWFWFFGPVFLGFAIAYFIPVFAYFRFVFVIGAYYLIWASAINTINWTFLTRSLLFLALAVNLTSATFYFLIPRFQRENWREATSYVIQNSSQKTISLFESDYPPGPFDYYSRGQVKAEGALNGYNADQSKVREKLNVLTQDKQKVFLFQYLSGITDPAGLVFQELTRLGFKNTRTRDFNGVGFVYEFER